MRHFAALVGLAAHFAGPQTSSSPTSLSPAEAQVPSVARANDSDVFHKKVAEGEASGRRSQVSPVCPTLCVIRESTRPSLGQRVCVLYKPSRRCALRLCCGVRDPTLEGVHMLRA